MDRRILVIDGLDKQKRQEIQTLSDLSVYPQVVLLGEPGIGKSTALKFMANLEECNVTSVRALMNGAISNLGKPLFLDALDEYRSDGSTQDKIYGLAKLIAEWSANRWRLTCRAEDWRSHADAHPFIEMGAAQKIVVAQLLPLHYREACSVLSNLGEENPEEFVDRAEALGAHAFTENPLSLKLLHKAVSYSGTWPATRFALFTSAIEKLSSEHNPVYQADYERSSPDKIIEATGKIALLQLLSGTRAIWRSQGTPPDDADRRAFITMHDVKLKPNLLSDSLDTPLFRGEGESFEFMHRTIAEFLAGQALASAVTANGVQARFPLRRALALLIGSDRKPPTELRGIFAWFAAHLAQQGDHSGAKRMAEIDACSLLTYGDAAALSVETRRVLLRNLDRDDPYFRGSEQGVTVLGGLLDEALIEDIIEILKNPPEESHLLLTVAESLTSGRPIPALQPHLKQFVLDPSRAGWQRKRVLEAFIHGSTGRTSDLRELFDELTCQTASVEREELRIEIACELHPEQLDLPRLQKLLTDFESTPDDNTVGRLFSLEKVLAKNPCSALFEEAYATWRLPTSNLNRSEVNRLLDNALAACILSSHDLTGKKIWHWVANSREYFWHKNEQEEETKAAVGKWLDAGQHRESELFEAVLAMNDRRADEIFCELCGRWPSESTLQSLLVKVKSGNAENVAPGLLAIYVEKARQIQTEPALFWEIYELLEDRPELTNLLMRLTTTDVEYGRPAEFRNQARAAGQQLKQAQKIAELTALIPELKHGKHLGILRDAASRYFQRSDFRKPCSRGFERVISDTNQDIAEAILEGWQYWATEGIQAFDFSMLSSACTNIYHAEYVAVAGLTWIIEKQTQGDIPEAAIQPLILATLRCSPIGIDNPVRQKLGIWIANQLARQGEQGSDLLTAFWRAYLEANASYLAGMDELTSQPAAATVLSVTLTRLLTEQDSLTIEYLRPMLVNASKVINQERIEELCCTALRKETIAADVCQLWELVQFFNLPTIYQPPSTESIDANQASDILHLLNQFELPDNDCPPENHRAIACFIVELAGSFITPDSKGDWNLRTALRHAINRLCSYPETEATTMLKTLIEKPKLHAWKASLQHALSQQTRLHCDHVFIHPSIQSIHEALAGGPPVNAADLFAIAVEELRRLQTELRTTNTTAWKEYWNRDQHGKATEALIENECRNHLLERLKDRLVPYQIFSAMPEAQSADSTRVDILLQSGTGTNIPIEAKRHFHPDVWSAAETQLQGYATAQGADGHGIYLVFWFGSEYKQTPPVPKTQEKPDTAMKMEAILYDRLPEVLRLRTEVIVFNVSRQPEK